MTMVDKARPGLFIGAAAEDGGREPWFLDPKEIWRTVRLRRLVILAPVVLLLAAAAAWAVFNPPQYAASTQLLIDPRGLQVVKDGITPPDQATDASLLLVDSQARVLTSDDVLRRVVEAQHLQDDPDFRGRSSPLDALRGLLSRLAGRQEPEADPTLAALRILRDRTSAKRLERSFVVEIGVTTDDREKSARLSRAVAETYLALDTSTRAGTTRKAGTAIEGRLDQLRDSLRGAEDRAQAFRAKNGLVGTRTQLVSEQQLTQLSDQLGAARARTAEAAAKVRQIEGVLAGGSSDSVTEIVQNQTVSQLRGQLAGVERARADAENTLGRRHPTYLAAIVQERALREAIAAEIRRIAAADRNDYKAAMSNEAALSATLERRKTEATKVGGDFVQLRELERQVEASRGVYEAFLVRARELQEQQRLDTSASRVISPATPPERRTGPPTPVLFGAALAAGLGLGLVGALGLELATGRARSRRRLESHTGLTVLDALPAGSVRGDGGPVRAADQPYEVALSRLRHRLHGTTPGARPLAVLVTGADDARGKSSLALSLALSAAADRERVLLVDADPAGRLTRNLGLRPRLGLADALQGGAIHHALAVHPSGMSFLPRPERLPRGQAGSLADAVLDAGSGCDLVVVDLGLVGADVVAERLLSDPRFSAILLPVDAARGSLRAVDRAVSSLGGDRRLRLVLTGADPRD